MIYKNRSLQVCVMVAIFPHDKIWIENAGNFHFRLAILSILHLASIKPMAKNNNSQCKMATPNLAILFGYFEIKFIDDLK